MAKVRCRSCIACWAASGRLLETQAFDPLIMVRSLPGGLVQSPPTTCSTPTTDGRSITTATACRAVKPTRQDNNPSPEDRGVEFQPNQQNQKSSSEENTKKEEESDTSDPKEETAHDEPVEDDPITYSTTKESNRNNLNNPPPPTESPQTPSSKKPRHVVIIGAGWGGLSTAYSLSSLRDSRDPSPLKVTVVEAAPRVGGLVRDGFTTMSGHRPAEAGQHGFWRNYHNIYRLLDDDRIPNLSTHSALTDYAEQGQYSPNGLEAVWPVYRDQPLTLPTGLAQAAFTRFLKLPLLDRATAFPLVLAFCEFDDSPEAWERYDKVSFRDLCIKLGVSQRCYDEAFEPMILTGLFAPGAECSAAAALGMAYFFVLQSQTAFDVQWCKGNIGEVIFQPWVDAMEEAGVHFQTSTRVTGFEIDSTTNRITHVKAQHNPTSSSDDKEPSMPDELLLEADEVVFAVGAKALNNFVTYYPELGQYPELARFANLRGTSVLANRLFLDRDVEVPFTANACWGFDDGVGMTVFDIKGLHGEDASTVADAPGSVIEVDYYYASKLLVLSDEDIVAKAKRDLDTILVGSSTAKVVDAAVVRLPQGVNWYYPGSYQDMPDTQSKSVPNLYFAGDIVRSRHGSWSQEKSFVTGMEAANAILGNPKDHNILPVAADELHVQAGKTIVNFAKTLLGKGDPWKGPSLVDFFR